MPRKTKAKTEKIDISQKSDTNTNLEQKTENSHNIFDAGGELVVDVFETNSDFVVLTAIAGVRIQDLDITVEKDMMVIRGQRENPENNTEKKYFYQECYWGPFSKKIVLPENIDTKAAAAQIDRGILTIKIPKIESEKVKSLKMP